MNITKDISPLTQFKRDSARLIAQIKAQDRSVGRQKPVKFDDVGQDHGPKPASVAASRTDCSPAGSAANAVSAARSAVRKWNCGHDT